MKARQLPGRATGQQPRHPGGAKVPREPAEHRDERGERQAIGA